MDHWESAPVCPYLTGVGAFTRQGSRAGWGLHDKTQVLRDMTTEIHDSHSDLLSAQF